MINTKENIKPSFNTKSYIYYLKEGEWENIFNNAPALLDIAKKIFIHNQNDKKIQYDYFDWIKRITVMIINLAGYKLKDIFSPAEINQVKNQLIKDCGVQIKNNDYTDTIHLIKYLNEICQDFEKNPDETLKKFKKLLNPNNDNLLTIFIIMIVEKIIGINFYGLISHGKPALVLNHSAEKFINLMSREPSIWLKILRKIKIYFKNSNNINIVRAYEE